MSTLLVGFDSAWTRTNSGAIVGVLRLGDGTFHELGLPLIADYSQARSAIFKWRDESSVTSTIILLDQPTIVENATGQRIVEKIVSSAVGRRRGGMQPANTSEEEMFGGDAPIWPFLAEFGGPANPLEPGGEVLVIETYPVLAIIALVWTLPDIRPSGRLPKYNPDRRKTFSISDWQHVCKLTATAFRERGLMKIVRWIDDLTGKASPQKTDQDGIDACLCLLVALHLAEREDCLMVGNRKTGYIVVPDNAELRAELDARCTQIGRVPAAWVRSFRLPRAKPKKSTAPL